MGKFLSLVLVALLTCNPVLICVAAAQQAQPASAPAFRVEELDQLVAPIALYPDELLAQIFAAATYPLQIVVAARWVAEPQNRELKGDALAKAVESEDWDPSVKSLVLFPAVLEMMSDKLEWTQKLGDAFLAQPADCFAAVQRLRHRAQSAGKLSSTPQQKVTTEANYIVIAPASPDVVYVPVYNPAVVYDAWPYPAYPPYAFPPPPGYYYGAGIAAGIGFAVGVGVVGGWWGWGRPNWSTGNITININRWNSIRGPTQLPANVNRANVWQLNPANRGGVPYRDAATRQRYANTVPGAAERRDYRGFSGTSAARPATLPATSNRQANLQRPANVNRSEAGNRPANVSRPANVNPSAKVGRPANVNPSAKVGRPAATGQRPSQLPAAGAFNPGNGAQARADMQRGLASRQQMSAPARAGGGRVGGGFRR
jgi:hypothetical protein